jgi:hypothetical protein
MFGRDDNHDEVTAQEPQHDAVLGDGGTTVQPQPDEHNSPAFTDSAPISSDAGATTPLPAPLADEPDDTATDADASAPSIPAPTPSDRLDVDGEHGDLIGIKQSALKELSPLVGHLDQTPEEKFRTTMMMIQASDNQALIKDAYDAAQKITDEKVKAQALLDIVNEINYFTQHG